MLYTLVISLVTATSALASSGGWPGLEVSPEAAELFNALGSKTLRGRDAVSVFLGVIKPGQYKLRVAHRDFILQLNAEPHGRSQADLRIVMSHAGLQLERTFLVHTGEGTAPKGVGQFSLRAFRYDGPSLRFSLKAEGEEETVVRVKFTSNMRKLAGLTLSGPLLDSFKELALEQLADGHVKFNFVNWRPPFGLELDCRKLLYRLITKPRNQAILG